MLEVLGELELAPKRVLEIGAADGLRLAALRTRLPVAQVVALDPSHEALRAGAQRCIAGARATAERLPFRDGAFELVILGFCLYLVDREDLFAIAAEVDRVLAATAHVAIFDFLPDAPQRRAYAHAPGLYSYKMDYAQMFLWNPAYRRVALRELTHPGGDPRRVEDRLAVSVLARDAAIAWPEE